MARKFQQVSSVACPQHSRPLYYISVFFTILNIGLCGPYRRQWVRLQRLKSDIVGAKVRGVAHLDDRIYVVYSNEDRIGVYMDEKPYTSLGCIPIADMRYDSKYITYICLYSV